MSMTLIIQKCRYPLFCNNISYSRLTRLKTFQPRLRASSLGLLKIQGLWGVTLPKLLPNQMAEWLVTGIQLHHANSVPCAPPFFLEFWVTQGSTLLWLLKKPCSQGHGCITLSTSPFQAVEWDLCKYVHTVISQTSLSPPVMIDDMSGVAGVYRGTSGNKPTCQCWRCRRPGFDPWVGKIP